MKRKDWKIKKLIKNIYGKKIKFNLIKNRRLKKRKENMFFLRKLFLKKNLVLFKKNRIQHFHVFWKMFIHMGLKKKFNFDNFYNKNNFKYLTIFPDFFNKKQLLMNNVIFRKIMFEKKLSFFLKNKNNFGNNIVVFNHSNLDKIDLYLKLSENFEKEDNKNYVFSLKKNNFLNELKMINFYYDVKVFNFFFNYNIHININLEIYKILIILYFFKKK